MGVITSNDSVPEPPGGEVNPMMNFHEATCTPKEARQILDGKRTHLELPLPEAKHGSYVYVRAAMPNGRPAENPRREFLIRITAIDESPNVSEPRGMSFTLLDCMDDSNA